MSRFPDFHDTVRERAAREPAFRHALLVSAAQCLLENDAAVARITVSHYLAGLALADLAKPPTLDAAAIAELLDLSRDLPAEAVLAALGACLSHEGIELTVKQRTPRTRRKAAAERLAAVAE